MEPPEILKQLPKALNSHKEKASSVRGAAWIEKPPACCVHATLL